MLREVPPPNSLHHLKRKPETPRRRKGADPNAMKILVVCNQGNNRSVTLAGQLKYLGNDVLTAGIATNGDGAFWCLLEWAEKVIFTEDGQRDALLEKIGDPANFAYLQHTRWFELWDLGPDNYPRPYNAELLAKVKQLIKEHPKIDSRGPKTP